MKTFKFMILYCLSVGITGTLGDQEPEPPTREDFLRLNPIFPSDWNYYPYGFNPYFHRIPQTESRNFPEQDDRYENFNGFTRTFSRPLRFEFDQKKLDGRGVARHPDGSTSFVGSQVHGIGKRSAEPVDEKTVNSAKDDVESAASTGTAKRLTPLDLKYKYGYPYPYPYLYDRYEDYAPYKRPYWPYNYGAYNYPYGYGYGLNYPYYGHGYRHPYSYYRPGYLNYWDPDYLPKDINTKQVSVHPKGGVSYVSKRILGAG